MSEAYKSLLETCAENYRTAVDDAGRERADKIFSGQLERSSLPEDTRREFKLLYEKGKGKEDFKL